MEDLKNSTKKADKEIDSPKVKKPCEVDKRPWHEKYRRESLDDIVGQDEAINYLYWNERRTEGYNS